MATVKERQTVSSTEFQNAVGDYMERSGRAPVFITRHKRPARVLMDIEEYERLKKRDTREALWAWELTGDEVEAIERAENAPYDPDLDKLMEE